LGFKNIPEEFLDREEFTTKPWNVLNDHSYRESDNTINVNGLRYELARHPENADKDKLQRYLEEFNKRRQEIDPNYSEYHKIDLIFNGHIFPYNQRGIKMLTQIKQWLGFEDDEEITEEKVKALIQPKPDDSTGDKIVILTKQVDGLATKIEAVENENQTLKNELKIKSQALDQAINFQANQKLQDRKIQLNSVFEDGRISGAQLKDAEATYVEIEPD